jgi:hypothetical protein
MVVLEDDSPYPEVRAAVANTDIDMPVNTLRAWVIGVIFAILVPGPPVPSSAPCSVPSHLPLQA